VEATAALLAALLPPYARASNEARAALLILAEWGIAARLHHPLKSDPPE
jgi:hypothetical protein